VNSNETNPARAGDGVRAMGPMKTHLWKEWREHRGICLAIALAFPVLTLLCELVTMRLPSHGALPAMAALAAFGTVAFALFGEAFAGEERRDTLAFLRRQPGGWAPPFLAKHLFLLLAVAVLTAWTYGMAALLAWAFHGVAPDPIGAKGLETTVELLLLLPLWSIAVSIAFPRSTIALPAAAFVLGVLVAPILVACAWARGGWAGLATATASWSSPLAVLRTSSDALAWALRILVVAAPVVAALAFARGRMVERGRWRAAWIGGVAALALFTPGYAWTAMRVADFRRLEVHDPTFRIGLWSCVSTNGRFAYVNVWNATDDAPPRLTVLPEPGVRPTHALRVDLVDGTSHAIAAVGARVGILGGATIHSCAPFVCIDDPAAAMRPAHFGPEAGRAHHDSRLVPLLDADTGAPFRADLDEAFASARDDAGARQQRLANALVLPDGGRAWIERGHVVRSDASGTVRALPDSDVTPSNRIVLTGSSFGHGVLLGRGEYYDVLRERRFAVPEPLSVRWIHAGQCVVWNPVRTSSRGGVTGGEWLRWDPDARTVAPIVGLASDEKHLESIHGMADDGRLFVATVARPKAEPFAPRLALLDPDTGARESIELPEATRSWEGVAVFIQARTPSGVPVMSLADLGWKRVVFARFDLERRRFEVANTGLAEHVELVGCDSEDSILVNDGRRLLRAWFGRPGVEVVFPKSDG